MSRAIFEAPTTSPWASFTGEIVSETLRRDPSLRKRIVSKWSTRSPRLSRARILGSSSRWSGGIKMLIDLPMTSAAVYPNRRCAP